MSTAVITVGENEIYTNTHKVCLTSGLYSENIPDQMDISAIQINNPNLDIIDKVAIYYGSTKLMSFEGDDINNITLPEDGLLLSKTLCDDIFIVFYFNKNYIRKNTIYTLKDEYKTDECDTDQSVMVRHPETGLVICTCIVEKNKVPTGNKISIPSVFPTILIPDITLTLSPEKDIGFNHVTPYWEKRRIDPSYDPIDSVKIYENNNTLRTLDLMTIDEYYATNMPFVVKVLNKIEYNYEPVGKFRINLIN
jgi:hypothetical protein